MTHLLSTQRAKRRVVDSFEFDDERKRELVSRGVDEFERPRNQPEHAGIDWTVQSRTADRSVRTTRRRRMGADIRLNDHGVDVVWRRRGSSDS